MNRRPWKIPVTWRWAGLALLVTGLCGLAWSVTLRRPATPAAANVTGLPPAAQASEYLRVTGPVALSFPCDDGPHPDYLTEWWYYTGNLQTADGRRFGFQLTFFRRALAPPASVTPRESAWAANQIYMAHFTLMDVAGKQFHYFERFARGAAGLAGAQSDPAFQVWLQDWSVQQLGQDTYQIHAQQAGVALDLRLVDSQGRVLQGDRGYSQKGPEPGNASLYYSQPRLDAQGSVTVGGQKFPVNGTSWMDREISTSALSPGEVGWDWFALQLDNGRELMAYVLRRADGTVSDFSTAAYIHSDGTMERLTRSGFQITSEATWRSPHSGATYPARWRVRVPSVGLDLQVQPLLADQELNVSFIYWEGAVAVSGAAGGLPTGGYGYVELTGYARSMEGGL